MSFEKQEVLYYNKVAWGDILISYIYSQPFAAYLTVKEGAKWELFSKCVTAWNFRFHFPIGIWFTTHHDNNSSVRAGVRRQRSWRENPWRQRSCVHAWTVEGHWRLRQGWYVSHSQVQDEIGQRIGGRTRWEISNLRSSREIIFDSASLALADTYQCISSSLIRPNADEGTE